MVRGSGAHRAEDGQDSNEERNSQSNINPVRAFPAKSVQAAKQPT